MAFPQWQPGLSSEQDKFALGLKRPTITLTSVQARFERQGKFLNFYEVYGYFRKIFFVIYWFFIWKNLFSWIFMKFMSIFGRFFFFFSHIDFLFQNFFSWMFIKFMSIFERMFFFESYIDFSSLIAWRSVHPLKSWELFVHVRSESTIWTI